MNKKYIKLILLYKDKKISREELISIFERIKLIKILRKIF